MNEIVKSLRASWEEWLGDLGVQPGEQTAAHWQAFKSLVDGALVIMEADDKSDEPG